MRRFFDWLGRWVDRHEKILPIGEGGYVLRWKVARYGGPRLVLQDGTVVERGDSIGELHLDNQLLAAMHAGVGPGFRFRREVFRALAALGRELRAPEYRAINAVYGTTLFSRYPLPLQQVGFEILPVPPFTRWWLGTWERIVLSQYHPEGRRRLRQGRRMEPRNLWVTRRVLLRHAEGAAAAGDRL